METQTIYKLNASSLNILWECKAPGIPYSITVVGEELRVLCGETDEDNRFIRRCIPDEGFDTTFGIACPDDTGSQLSFDGNVLHVSQWYNKLILGLNDKGSVTSRFESQRGICGQVIIGNRIYIANTDAEETNDYYLSYVDRDTGKFEDVARIPFGARSLAFDGENLWTNHREQNEIVCFAMPEA